MTVLERKKIQPEFKIFDMFVPNLSEKKPGDVFKAIINYKVTDKTKSFTMLKVTFVHITNTQRKQ